MELALHVANIEDWEFAPYDVLQVSYNAGGTFMDMDTIRTPEDAAKAKSIVQAGRVRGYDGWIHGQFRIAPGHKSKHARRTYFYAET